MARRKNARGRDGACPRIAVALSAIGLVVACRRDRASDAVTVTSGAVDAVAPGASARPPRGFPCKPGLTLFDTDRASFCGVACRSPADCPGEEPCARDAIAVSGAGSITTEVGYCVRRE